MAIFFKKILTRELGDAKCGIQTAFQQKSPQWGSLMCK